MTTTTTPTTSRRDLALVAARVIAGLLGTAQVGGMIYFTVLAPEEAVWLGPWLDVPIVGLLVTGIALKLAFALMPGIDVGRRIGLGFLAVAVGAAVTLIKVPLYDEPESLPMLAIDVVVLLLLLRTRQAVRR